MDIVQITAVIGAAASLLCTLVVGGLTFFVKKMISDLESADKRNAAAIEKVDQKQSAALKDLEVKQDKHLKELSGQLSDLKSDLPLVYTLREDFIRSMNNVDRSMSGLDQKLDKVLMAVNPQRREE